MRFRNTLIALSAATVFVLSGFSVANATNCGQVFPTGLNGYVTGCTIPSGWANALEDKIGIKQSTVTSSLDYQINHIFTSYGSEEIASSAIPWLGSYSTTTILLGSSTVSGPAFTFATSTASGKWGISASGTILTWTLPSNISFFTNDAGYLTANQSITWTAAGDISGSASGATTITPSLTVTGLNGKALPSLTEGALVYSGSAWAISYPLAAAYGGTATTTALGSNAFTSGGFPSIATTTKGAVVTNGGSAIATTTFTMWMNSTGATTTMKQVSCMNAPVGGNTFTLNLSVSSTVNTATGTVFASPITCNSTSTYYATSTSVTMSPGAIVRAFIPTASTTEADIQFSF